MINVFLDGPIRKSVLTSVIGFGLLGCASLQKPKVEDAPERYGLGYAVTTATPFSRALVCMDQMMLDREVDPIFITATPIPDYTENRGAAGYGAREMLLSAISRMTEESAAVRYVAFDRSTPDIVALHNGHPSKSELRVPDFFVRGAVTQINTSPFSKQSGWSATVGASGETFQGGNTGISGSMSLATVSLDLSIGLVKNYQMLPGISASNSFSVVKLGDSNELSLSFEKVGAVLRSSESEAKALSDGLRALIELGAIELTGKLYELPYWECLAASVDAEGKRAVAAEAYDKLSERDREQFIRNYLIDNGYLSVGGNALEYISSLMKLRFELDMVGVPRLDKDLYVELMSR